MPAGVVIYNDSDTIQIDETYRNLSVVAKGTASSGSTPKLVSPLLAVQSSGLAYGYGSYTYGSSVVSLGIAGSSARTWWLFDANNAQGDFGFQVFDSQGNLVYDATHKPLRVIDELKASTEAGWNGVSRTYPSGRSYAVIQGATAASFKETVTKASAGQWKHHEVWKYAAAKVVGNVVTFGWLTTHDQTWTDDTETQSWEAIYPKAHFLVVDVTNY